jgi:putative ABC transport system permease protein
MLALGTSFVVFSMFLFYGFVRFNYWAVAESFARTGNGHIQIASPAWFKSVSPELYRTTRAQLAIEGEKILRHAELRALVRSTSLRRQFSGTIASPAGSSVFTLGFAVEAAHYDALSSWAAVEEGEGLDETRLDGVVLGAALAESIGVKPGDAVTLLVATDDGRPNVTDATVLGITRSMSRDFDASYLLMPIDAAMSLLQSDEVDSMVVGLADTSTTNEAMDQVAAGLAKTLSAKSWSELSDYYLGVKAIYDRIFGFVFATLIAVGSLAVANAMLITVTERRQEIAILRAIGGNPRQICGIFVLESLMALGLGATLGLSAAWLIAQAVEAAGGFEMAPPPGMSEGYNLVFRLDVNGGLAILFVTLLVASLAAWIPVRLRLKQGLASALTGAESP